jgi:hypothetical protein
MTNNARTRHTAQGRASRIAGRTALGVLAAPMAMLAVAGPAGAAALDLDSTLGDALDVNLAADDVALPSVDSVVSTLPTELPDSLPIDGVAFEGVKLDLFDLGGQDDLDLALPAVGDLALPELPAELPALPGTDALPVAGALGAVPVALPELPLDGLPELPLDGLPALPAVGDLALPELPALPSTDSLPSLPVDLPVDVPSLPSVGDLALPEAPALPDAVGTVTDLTAGLPTAAQLDLDDVTSTATDSLPAAADVFSATDLVQGLI